MQDIIETEIDKTIATMQAVRADAQLMADAQQVAKHCVEALKNGNKILFCGNGGSAADAQHLAAELVGKLNYNRPALAAIALTTDTSALTAIGNDLGYAEVFSRQVEALGQEGDVLIALSTSGTSANVVRAAQVAKARGLMVIGKTGQSGGDMRALCDVCLCIPSTKTSNIQECHILLGHIYCGLIESECCPEA